jgi:hypothetical protein
MRVAACGLITMLALSLGGQDRYAPLRNKLGVTDSQSSLSAAQRAKLSDIVQVLTHSDMAAGAIVMGLMAAGDWPAHFACPLYRIGAYAREFDLSDDQVSRLEELEIAARQPNLERQQSLRTRHRQLADSGTREDSPEVAALMADLKATMKRYAETRPPRDAAWAVLNDAQRARLAAFESDLELAGEALELHLIDLPPLPEVLCH